MIATAAQAQAEDEVEWKSELVTQRQHQTAGRSVAASSSGCAVSLSADLAVAPHPRRRFVRQSRSRTVRTNSRPAVVLQEDEQLALPGAEPRRQVTPSAAQQHCRVIAH